MRKLLTPAFHFQILERFISIYEEQGQIFLAKLRKLSQFEVINIVPWFHAYTLDVISGIIRKWRNIGRQIKEYYFFRDINGL